jgi:hypothetical protein
MLKWLTKIFPVNPKEQHADETRDQTHEAINDLQRAIITFQAQSKHDKKQIIDILSQSESELSSVAQKVAAATGATNRGYKH